MVDGGRPGRKDCRGYVDPLPELQGVVGYLTAASSLPSLTSSLTGSSRGLVDKAQAGKGGGGEWSDTQYGEGQGMEGRLTGLTSRDAKFRLE